jgi:hypothetical protein
MESSEDYHQDLILIERWLERWATSATLAKDTEYTWQVEAPLTALSELPRRMFIHTDWATYPISKAGVLHDAWNEHFDDGKGLPGFGGRTPNKSPGRTCEE